MKAWEDTVMDDLEMQMLAKDVSRAEADHKIATRQAEISFKAGYEQVWKDKIIQQTFDEGKLAGYEDYEEELGKTYAPTFKDGKRTGIREVVEWIDKDVCWREDAPYKSALEPREWQAFKKKKGLE